MGQSLVLPRVIKLGNGCLQEVGSIATDLGASHLFIVTGSLLKKGLFRTQLDESILEQGLKATYFSDFQGEPNTDHLHAALTARENCAADCVVAIGGGSAIDLAKAVSVFAVNKGISFDDIPGRKKLNRLPFIAVPTTAGTGSEATKITVITDVKSGVKRNPGHPSLIPDAAILDPQLTFSLPKTITAYTGLDTLAHAMEAYVSTKATSFSDHLALEAMRLIGEFLPKVYENGEDMEAREKMLLASCYAGIAFSNASTNLAHAAARPLGARFHIPHGLSVAMLLPFIIEFGLEVSEERYAKAAKALGSSISGNQPQLAQELLTIIQQYNTDFRIWEDGLRYFEQSPISLEDSLPTLIQDALSGNGVLTNQKIPTAKDVEVIYRKLLFELQREKIV
jgi:alcohol dehydrogenase class IV